MCRAQASRTQDDVYTIKVQLLLVNCSKLDIYLRFEEPLTMDQLSILKNWVKRRIKHEPPQ